MQVQRLFQEAQNLHRKGQLNAARKRYELILTKDPNHSPSRLYLAIILQQAGQIQDAVREAKQALTSAENPDATMLTNYGVIMKNAGLLQEAEDAYKEALMINPELLSVKANLATLQLITGKLDQAEHSFLELTEKLEEPAPWLNLARIYIVREQTEKIKQCLQKAEDIAPKHPDIPFLKARVLAIEKDDEKAFEYLKIALSHQPAHAEAWQILQSLEQKVIELDFIEKVSINLAKTGVQNSILLATAVDICRKNMVWPALEKLEKLLTESLSKPLEKNPGTSATFTLLGANVPQWGHLKAAELSWKHIVKNITQLGHRKPEKRDPEKKIKVGILSSDLRGHAVGYLIVGLLENLPSKNIQWFAYNNSFSDDSDSRERIKSGFDRFINVASLNDQELAQRIRQDEIDILMDLNGMTRDTRVAVMAYRPAPVQITWLGMPGSMGAGSDIDYVIGDPWVTYKGNVDGFSEHIIQLPRSYQPNDHIPPDLSLAGNRSDHNLPDDSFVFCCFNQHYKISPDTFDLWCSILNKVENSVLWLFEPKSEAVKERIYKHLENAGLDADRMVFARHLPQPNHIARISLADLVLDTWPYNAHTTCSDALRAGVPVLTIPGQTFASRVAAGILDTAGLPEWIAKNHDEYVGKAVEFACQPLEIIKSDKEAVRDTYWTSKIVDNEGLGKMFETLCLGLYDRAVRGEPLCDLRLTEDHNLEVLPFSRETNRYVVGENIEKNNFEVLEGIQNAGRQAKIKNLKILQKIIIGLEHSPLVVDVGAADFEWDKQAFEPLVDAGLFRLLGFEPDENSFAKLMRSGKPNREYEQTAVGDGNEAELNICNGPHMNSLLEPNPEILSMFGYQTAKIVSKLPVKTKTLSEITPALQAAMLKLDTQGTELDILKHSGRLLDCVSVIQLEAASLPMYQKQPSIFELGFWLEKKGFILHSFAKENRMTYQTKNAHKRTKVKRQILELDPVFIPSPLLWESMDTKRLQEMAFIMHALYSSYDITMRILEIVDERYDKDKARAYSDYLKEAGFNA